MRIFHFLDGDTGYNLPKKNGLLQMDLGWCPVPLCYGLLPISRLELYCTGVASEESLSQIV